MALPSGFLDELRARTPLAALVGRRVKLARSGRNWTGCCPFHNEKTPSFYVYDDHFHCFGCGAHGDGVSFVMQAQGASFIEAVGMLAAEAGLEVPKPTPEAAAAEQHRADLHGVLDAAAASFQRRLFLPEGAAALAYLRGRGLTDATIRRFGLGWSGEGRGALASELGRAGIGPDQLEAAGLLRPAEPGQGGREFFFQRVMFPIRDRRGRTISFGGRTLGDGQPKYLNGPETAVFAKRRTLYALDLAREAVREAQPVVVVEGYMDVIALHQAGFGGAVAPLGTALTAEQLDALWRLSPAPVLCFDGDAAGGRAALRAMETALPLLAPDRSLRIAALPAGQDPDSLVRSAGRAAFEAVLQSARPMEAALFAALSEGAETASAEGRAALREKLAASAARIENRGLASEYRYALMKRFFQEFREKAKNFRQMPTLRAPFRLQDAGVERARILLGLVLEHPRIIPVIEEDLSFLPLPAELDRLRTAIWDWAAAAEVLDSADLLNHLRASGLAEIVAGTARVGAVRPGGGRDDVVERPEEQWRHFFGFFRTDALRAQVAEEERRCAQNLTPESQNRVLALRAELLALERGEHATAEDG